jgi:hypothetical protein
MNSYTLYPTPAPTPWDIYDRQMNGLHIDGILFAMLFFGSWLLFFVLWVWTRKPVKNNKLAPMPSKWEVPSDNWRN